MAGQLSPQGAFCLSEQPASARNSAPSTNLRASCFGKPLFPSRATPLLPRTRRTAASTSSSPQEAARIQNLPRAEFTSLLNYPTKAASRKNALVTAVSDPAHLGSCCGAEAF